MDDGVEEAGQLRKKIAYLTDLLQQRGNDARLSHTSTDVKTTTAAAVRSSGSSNTTTTRSDGSRGQASVARLPEKGGRFAPYTWRRSSATAAAAAASSGIGAGEVASSDDCRDATLLAAQQRRQQPEAHQISTLSVSSSRTVASSRGATSWCRPAPSFAAASAASHSVALSGSCSSASVTDASRSASAAGSRYGGGGGGGAAAKTSSEQLQAVLRQKQLDAVAAVAAPTATGTTAASDAADLKQRQHREPSGATTVAAGVLSRSSDVACAASSVARSVPPAVAVVGGRPALHAAAAVDDRISGRSAAASLRPSAARPAEQPPAAIDTAAAVVSGGRAAAAAQDSTSNRKPLAVLSPAGLSAVQGSGSRQSARNSRAGEAAAIGLLTRYKLVNKRLSRTTSGGGGAASAAAAGSATGGRQQVAALRRPRWGAVGLESSPLPGPVRQYDAASTYKLTKRAIRERSSPKALPAEGCEADAPSFVTSASGKPWRVVGSAGAMAVSYRTPPSKYVSKYKLVVRNRTRSATSSGRDKAMRNTNRYKLVRNNSSERGSISSAARRGVTASSIGHLRHSLDKRRGSEGSPAGGRASWSASPHAAASLASRKLAIRSIRTLVAASNTLNKDSTWRKSEHKWNASLNAAERSRHCRFFIRFGKCSKGSSCLFIHDPKRIAICTRFLRGTCRSESCLFSHELSKEKVPVCSYFVRGGCTRDNCPYLHVNVGRSAPPCNDFLDGYCPRGDSCTKRHSRECPNTDANGKCPAGDKCRLYHSKHRTKASKASFAKRPLTTAVTDLKIQPGSWWDEAAMSHLPEAAEQRGRAAGADSQQRSPGGSGSGVDSVPSARIEESSSSNEVASYLTQAVKGEALRRAPISDLPSVGPAADGSVPPAGSTALGAKEKLRIKPVFQATDR